MTKPPVVPKIHLVVDDERMRKHYGCPVTWCGHTRTDHMQTTTQPIVATCKICLKAFDNRDSRRVTKAPVRGVTGVTNAKGN